MAIVTGTNDADSLIGTNGDDYVTALDGNDTVFAGPGQDTIDGGNGRDSLRGAEGDDVIDGGLGSDVLRGNEGNDVIRGGGSEASLSDQLFGDDGNDTLIGGAGEDYMDGGAGYDIAYVNDARDVTYGAELVIASVDYNAAFFARDATQIRAADGNAPISLTGNGVAALIIGNDGDNVLRAVPNLAGAGADTLAGGFGNDVYGYLAANTVIEEQDGQGFDTIYADYDFDLNGFNIRGSGAIEVLSAADQTATTNLTLIGNAYTQTIVGNYGNNRLESNGGSDTLIGLRGDDVYEVYSTQTLVVEAAGEGFDTVIVDFPTQNYKLAAGASVELLQAETSFQQIALNIEGNAFSQRIEGSGGANILSSGGGGGIDTLVGYLGDDIYRVFATGDVIEDTGGFDTVYASGTSYFLYATAGIEYLSAADQAGTDPIYLVGNGTSQVIAGNYGDNTLNGRGGDGSVQADTLVGLYGNDAYAVFGQGDVVREQAGQGIDTVYANADYQLRDGTEIEGLAAADAASAAGAFTLRGNDTAQTIVGNQAANMLDGRGGGDTLIGLGGADSFAFTTALGAGNVDTIQDFAAGDRIALASDVFAAVTEGGIAAGEWVLGTAAADADDRLIYDQASGKLWYDADGNGAGAAVQFAQLAAGTALAAADFVVVAPVASIPAA
jgi:Ca2+-binding RTX toxin-like protein